MTRDKNGCPLMLGMSWVWVGVRTCDSRAGGSGLSGANLVCLLVLPRRVLSCEVFPSPTSSPSNPNYQSEFSEDSTMQATIPPKTLISPTIAHTHTRRPSNLRGFHKKNSSLSISAVSQNVTTPEAQDAIKRALAKKAVGLVKSGMVVGLGTGSTASIAIEELGRLIKQGKLKDVVAVGANYQSRVLARQYGVKTVDLNDINNIDIAFDGADEVDFNKNLLKGGGAAHTMQKVVDSVAKECVILADQSKVVFQLGCTFPVPVEVIPPAISPVLRWLVTLGGIPEIRSALRKDGPVITDLGNMVVDVSFPNGLENPADLEKSINLIPGVVENGIVCGIATSVLVAIQDRDSVTVMDLDEYVKIVGVPSNANSTI